MAKRLFFITRSFPPDSKTGGALVRQETVRLLRQKGFDVKVVRPAYSGQSVQTDDEFVFSFPSKLITPLIALEHLGIVSDYLSPWAYLSYQKLKKIVEPDDLIIAISGGEQGCIQLAYLLKQNCNCKVIVNLHDPINHTSVLEKKVSQRFHVNRDKYEAKLFSKVDHIVTSSKLYASFLKQKYPTLATKFSHWYFGYSETIESKPQKFTGNRLSVLFAGNMNNKQNPHIIVEQLKHSKNFNKIDFHFFGFGSGTAIIKDYAAQLSNVYFHGFAEQQDIRDFAQNNCQVGFVPLIGSYFRPFIPSKIYEYINLNLPMLGLLPNGDAAQVIEDNGFGAVANDQTPEALISIVDSWFENPEIVTNFSKNLEDKKENWSIEETSQNLLQIINNLTRMT